MLAETAEGSTEGPRPSSAGSPIWARASRASRGRTRPPSRRSHVSPPTWSPNVCRFAPSSRRSRRRGKGRGVEHGVRGDRACARRARHSAADRRREGHAVRVRDRARVRRARRRTRGAARAARDAGRVRRRRRLAESRRRKVLAVKLAHLAIERIQRLLVIVHALELRIAAPGRSQHHPRGREKARHFLLHGRHRRLQLAGQARGQMERHRIVFLVIGDVVTDARQHPFKHADERKQHRGIEDVERGGIEAHGHCCEHLCLGNCSLHAMVLTSCM